MGKRQESKYKKRHDAAWWSKSVREIENSPESTETACSRLGVSSTSFYKWRRKLGSTSKTSPNAQSFETMDIDLFGASGECEMIFPSGRRLLLRNADLINSLPTIISAMEEAKC